MPTQTGDVATALVVSQKQNEALEAFNKELELQNTTLQKKCDALTEKYGLSEPQEGDDKGKQLYSRYLEMKSSLSSLSVVLEEAKDDNTKLTECLAELETELDETKKKRQQQQQQQQEDTAAPPKDADGGGDSESVLSSSSNASIITPKQEKALKKLVEKLEVQILGYRDAELQHQLVRAELEATVDRLDREAAVMREQLSDDHRSPRSTMMASTADLERCYEALASKIATTEFNAELQSLRASMDAAAAESTRLLNELESVLLATRDELETERTKKKSSRVVSETLEEEKKEEQASPSSEQRLLDEIESLRKQTERLKSELEQKANRLEKSEKRVATKHEQALQLTKANGSLRDGIQKLKGHLSSISEQATTTEQTLATTREALDAEKETTELLTVERNALQTKIDVIQLFISRNSDIASSENIELTASLAASRKEVSLARERVKKLVDSKKELELALEATGDDLRMKLRLEKRRTAELSAGLSAAERDLNGTRLLVAAATRKLVQLEETKLKDGAELKKVLESNRAMSRECTELSKTLKTVQAHLEAEKKESEGSAVAKTKLETRIKGTEQCLEDVRNQNAKLTEEAKESARQFEELEKLLATTQDELTEEEQRVEILEKQVDDTTQKLQHLERAKSDVDVSLDTVKSQLFTLNAKNKTLECVLRAEKDYNDSSDNEANNSKLPGSSSSFPNNGDEGGHHDDGDAAKDDDGDDDVKSSGGVAQKFEWTKRIESLLGRLNALESENIQLKSSLATIESADESKAETTTTTTTAVQPNQEQTTTNTTTTTTTIDHAATSTNPSRSEPTEESTATASAASDDNPSSTAPIIAAAERKALVQSNAIMNQSIFDTATLSSYASTESSSSDVVRRWEAELLRDNATRELKDALKQNHQLTGQVDNLESSVESAQQSNALSLKECETHAMVNREMAQKIEKLTQQVASLENEKESLMEKMASMARRDQLQKASLQTSNDEVANLMKTMSDFQQKFEVLAEQVEQSEAEKVVRIQECEDFEAKWLSEKIEITERMARLQKEHDALTAKHDELRSKHVQTMMEEQSDWQMERVELNKKISQLEKKKSETGTEEPTADAAEPSYFSIRPCPTDRSLMNQKVGELEQDIQLLDVTLKDAKQDHLVATAELEVTRFKLSTCEEELEATREKLAVCEKELKMCHVEMQTVFLKNATDGVGFEARIRELEEELEDASAAMDATKKDHAETLNACRAELEKAKKDHTETLNACRAELEEVKNEHEVTRAVLDASKGELERCRKRYRQAETQLQDTKLSLAKTAVKGRDDTKAAEERESDLQLKHNACLQELKSCKKALQTMAKAKTTELDAATKEQEELQTVYDACRKELETCKEDLTEKDKVMKHIAKKQVVEQLEKDDEIEKKKQALTSLTDELNEAYVREKELEDKLDFAKQELFKTEKKVEAFETMITDGAGVYKEAIAKLNQSNDALTTKNRMLQEETEALRDSALTLQKEVISLKEAADARGLAGDFDNSNTSEIEQENLVMKDLLEKSHLSVTDAKNMQKKLSSQVETATKRETKLTKDIISLKARNAEMERRLLDQEQELDEFENDFALARNDARKVVEKLRSQLKLSEQRNQQLMTEGSSGLSSRGDEDLKARLKQLVHKNKRLQKEVDACRSGKEGGGR